MTNLAITTSWTDVADGPSTYVASPSDGTTRGTVMVAMEIFGVSAHIRDLCERLAAEGYTAVAPDFYHRAGKRSEFGYDADDRVAAMDHMRGLRREDVLADLDAVRNSLDSEEAPALVGFSLGGHIALLGATAAPYALAVDFYGGWTLDGGVPLAEPAPPLDGAASIAAYGTPVLLFVGTEDKLISPDEWARIGTRLTNYGVQHERVAYPGVPHGFMCTDRPTDYNASAATDAWSRLLEALGKRLG